MRNILDKLAGDDLQLPNLEVYRTAQAVVFEYGERENKSTDTIAAELGTTRGYLLNSLDPAQTRSPLSVDRAIEITRLTNDYRILEAMAKEFGLVVTKPEPINTSGETLVLALVDKGFTLEEHQGTLAKDIRESIKDGVLDENERRKLREDAFALMKKATEMLESLK